MVSNMEYNPTIKLDDVISKNLAEESWLHKFLFDADVSNKLIIKHHEISITIVFLYVLFVKWIGPLYMKNQKPYNLKNVIIIYNFMNAAFSFALATLLYRGLRDNWHRRCGIRKLGSSSELKGIISLSWLWLLNKHFDLLDTIFFTLRKKYNQISFLHVSHHVGILLLGLYIIKAKSFDASLAVGILLNSIIHVLMYTYYGLAACGPHMQKYLWWKIYMTQMQIVQFATFLLYLGHSFATGCEMMDTFGVLLFAFVALMLVMFLNFYRESYKKHQS